MTLKKLLLIALAASSSALAASQSDVSQAIGKNIECELMTFKSHPFGGALKVHEDTDLIFSHSGLYEVTYNAQVNYLPPIAVEYGIVGFEALLNGKPIKASDLQVAYNPGSLLYDNAITPFVHAHGMHDPEKMECLNECCPDLQLPLMCNMEEGPPCSPEEACPCYPPLPDLLDAVNHPKFVNKLVNIACDDYIFKKRCTCECGDDFYKISRVPFIADLGLVDCSNQPLFTPMIGFASKNQLPTYPGRTFVVESDKAIQVRWLNELVDANGSPIPLPTYVPVDQSIHIAMPMNPPYPASGIPTITHLHGGFTEYLSDGHPEGWATPNFAQKGPMFAKEVFTFDNAQEPMMLWYHDHTLGYTRLNNYSGLIGAYIIRGKLEEELIKKNQIPSGCYEVPLIIVDKKFTSDGQLFFDYCDQEMAPCAPQPSALPEFFGDFILVNGKAWPYLEVEPRPYRLRFLNGCDSRFLQMTVTDEYDETAIPFHLIGTDQGLLNSPIAMDELLLGPAQRGDVVFDFSHLVGKTLIVRNSANTPFPNGDPIEPGTADLVMAFKVTKPLCEKRPKSHLPTSLRKTPIKRLSPTAPDRQVLLFESTDQYCRIYPLLGTPSLGGLMWDAPITETPLLGTTEIWEIYNTTEDAHPIHLHSGNFQILDRRNFTANQDPMTGAITDIEFVGPPIEPTAAEKEGLFDTVIVYPAPEGAEEEPIGQMTRIIMHFTLPGDYVWHCHILSHEDNEMMRPMLVVPPPAIVPVSRSFFVNAKKGDTLQLNVNNALPFNAAFINNSSVVVRKVK